MLVVGIAGGTGSGKTTVVEKIIKRFHPAHVVVLPQDSYYRDNSNVPPEKRQLINFDHPSSLEFPLLIDHIKKLKAGKTIQQPIYSYITCTRSKETIKVKPAIIIPQGGNNEVGIDILTSIIEKSLGKRKKCT